MKAIYKEPTNCLSCSRIFENCPGYEPDCVTCIKNRTQEVDVMMIGVGMFGNAAVVSFKDGTIKTVSINDLTLRKD